MELLYHLSYIANLLQSAVPVASYPVGYKIQHSVCFSPCGILDVSLCVQALRLSTLEMTLRPSLRGRTINIYLLVFNTHQLDCMLRENPSSLVFRAYAPETILSDNIPDLLSTTTFNDGRS